MKSIALGLVPEVSTSLKRWVVLKWEAAKDNLGAVLSNKAKWHTTDL
jgi:hypothetical protein